MTSSKAKTFRNIIYSSFGKGITIVSAATASFIVARNLSPADYGVVGFAGIIIGFLGQFSDLGVGSAAIRRPTLDQHNLDTAFTLKVILSLGAFAAALLIAPFARQFFDHPATGNVIRILSLNFLVGIVGFLPLIVLTREINYRALVFPGVASSAVQCSLVVILVLHGGKYWAVCHRQCRRNIGGRYLHPTDKENSDPFRMGLGRHAPIHAVWHPFAWVAASWHLSFSTLTIFLSVGQWGVPSWGTTRWPSAGVASFAGFSWTP